MTGKAIIFSAPSGAGKTTIVQHLLKQNLNLEFSISACTRAPRGKEKHAKDYYFLGIDEFKKHIKANEFVEWEEVYTDYFYGTLKSEIDRIWKEGKHLIFDVDVVGGLNLKRYFKENALSIFVMPPDLATLENRLRNRGTDEEDRIVNRLAKAKSELILADQFDEIIINNDLNVALKDAQKVVTQFLNS